MMYPSSTLCRAQEALQHGRADSALLQNVRIVAEKAAAAWHLEALIADEREERQRLTRVRANAILQSAQPAQQADERRLSENPDRGFPHS